MVTACSSDAPPTAAEPALDADVTTTVPASESAPVVRPELHPILDQAPLHSEVAAHMPAGALAALEVETIIAGFDAHAHATVASQLWELWEDRLATCTVDGAGFERQRIVLPEADDPFWDPVRIPRDAFRPYTEDWNRSYAFGVNEAREFFEESDPVARFERNIDFGDCHESTYPFASLVAYDDIISSATPLNDLAVVTARAAREEDGLRATWSSALANLSGRAILDGLADWESCMTDLGAPLAVVSGDFRDALAALDREGEVEVALLDIVCSRDVFARIDVELLAAAINFADDNELVLLEALDQTDSIENVLVELNDE